MKVRIVYDPLCGFLDSAMKIKSELEQKLRGKVEVTVQEGSRGVFDVYADSNVLCSRFDTGKVPLLEEVMKKLNL